MRADSVFGAVRGMAGRASEGPRPFSFPPSDRSPLTNPQERLVLGEQIRPGGSAHNLHFAYRLRGAVDRPALERALGIVWRRHQGIRATFPSSQEQVFLDGDGPALATFEASGVGGAEEIVREFAAAPFDLARGPLLRWGLVTTGASEHLFVVGAHHSVFDAWSLDVLHRELSQLYRDPHTPLSDLTLAYSQYAQWERDRARDPEIARRIRRFWEEYLEGRPPLCGLDSEVKSSRPGMRSRMRRDLDAEVVAAVGELAVRLGTSAFTVLLSAFSSMLARMNGEGDLTILVPFSGRNDVALTGLMGYFVRLNPLRSRPAEARDFVGLIENTAVGVAGATENQDLPYGLAASLCGAVLGPSSVMFGYQNIPLHPLALEGLEVEDAPIDASDPDTGVYLNIVPRLDGGLCSVVDFDAGAFSAGWIQNFVGEFVETVRVRCTHPLAPLDGKSARASSRRRSAVPSDGANPPSGGTSTATVETDPSCDAGAPTGVLFWLIEEVADLLGVVPDAVDPNGSPLEAGLDSLKLMELASRAAADLGIVAPLRVFAAAGTLVRLAEDLMLIEGLERSAARGGRGELMRI